MSSTVAVKHHSPVLTTPEGLGADLSQIDGRPTRPSSARQLAGIAFLSLGICSLANYLLAFLVGLPLSTPWSRSRSIGIYRRIGPETGPQVFAAGSSLLIYGLDWPQISESLGKGIENWSVGGSSPEIWEIFQQRRPNPAMTIIGVSLYDMNEMRLTPDRASYVPLQQSISDLWHSRTGSDLSSRILTQYVVNYVRVVFPTAGWSDKVLVEVRHRLADAVGLGARLGDYEGVVQEREGVLDAGDFGMKLTDWSSGRMRRRLAALRAENHGIHEFLRGPKRRAFERILFTAQQHGPVVIVVLPVSQSYMKEFLDKNALNEFERMLNEDMNAVPRATVVRLDRVPDITNDDYFSDAAHLNSYGRRLTTPVFLNEISQSTKQK